MIAQIMYNLPLKVAQIMNFLRVQNSSSNGYFSIIAQIMNILITLSLA